MEFHGTKSSEKGRLSHITSSLLLKLPYYRVEMCKNFLRNPSKVTNSHQIPIQEKLQLVFRKIPNKHY